MVHSLAQTYEPEENGIVWSIDRLVEAYEVGVLSLGMG